MPKESFNRKQLEGVLTTSGLALAKRGAEVPVFECFCFTGEKCYTYNEVIAVESMFTSQFRGAVPGELLTKFVAACKDETVVFEDKESSVVVRSGKSQITLPVIGPEKFVHVEQTHTKFAEFELAKDFIRGVERCLISVSADDNAPSRCGVTFNFEESEGIGGCEMFATNGDTVAYYDADFKAFEGQFLAPELFCRALVTLGKQLKKGGTFVLMIPDDYGSIKAKFSDTIMLTSRLIDEVNAAMFHGIVDRYAVEDARFWKFPTKFADSIERAMLLSTTVDSELYCTLSIQGHQLDICTRTDTGEVKDTVDIVDSVAQYIELPSVTASVPVDKVRIALKYCDQICVNEECVVFSDVDKYNHYISAKR